jgi:hypothetical protein
MVTWVSAQIGLGNIYYQQRKAEEAKLCLLNVLKVVDNDPVFFQFWGLELLESLAAVCLSRGDAEDYRLYMGRLARYQQDVIESERQEPRALFGEQLIKLRLDSGRNDEDPYDPVEPVYLSYPAFEADRAGRARL